MEGTNKDGCKTKFFFYTKNIGSHEYCLRDEDPITIAFSPFRVYKDHVTLVHTTQIAKNHILFVVHLNIEIGTLY